MDQTEIVAYKRSWRDVLIGPPAQTAVQGVRPRSRPTEGARRPWNERRWPGRNSLAYFQAKTVQTMGGSSIDRIRHQALATDIQSDIHHWLPPFVGGDGSPVTVGPSYLDCRPT